MTGAPLREGDLTRDLIARTLLLFALPTLASTVLQSPDATVNSIGAGRGSGPAPLPRM